MVIFLTLYRIDLLAREGEKDLLGFYGSFRREIIILIMSMMPVSELRGAIPLGVSLGVEPRKVVVLSVLGNMMIVPLLLKLLDPVLHFLARTEFFSGIIGWLRRRTLRRTKEKVKKYRVLGLFLFVAVPLPTTGAWTGCLAASMLQLDFKKSLAAIWSGIVVSGLIVSTFTYHLVL